MLAVSLFVLVSLLGFLTLTRGFSRDLWLLLFCHVMASCQYSLLKARPRPRPAPAPCTPKAPDGDRAPLLCVPERPAGPRLADTRTSPLRRGARLVRSCAREGRSQTLFKRQNISGRVCAECVNRKSKWKYPAWWPRRAWPWAWPGSGGAEGVGDPLCPAGVLAGAAQAPPSHRLCLCARPSARMLDPAPGLTVRASVSPCVDKEVQGPWGLNDPCGVPQGHQAGRNC